MSLFIVFSSLTSNFCRRQAAKKTVHFPTEVDLVQPEGEVQPGPPLPPVQPEGEPPLPVKLTAEPVLMEQQSADSVNQQPAPGMEIFEL